MQNMQYRTGSGGVASADVGTVRLIGRDDLRTAMAQGMADFREMRGDILLIGFLYPAIGLVVATVALQDRLLPVLFPLVAGLSLLGPSVAAGFYELARRREDGQESGWRHFFDVFSGPALASLAALTLLLAALFLLWLGAAWSVYQMTLGQLDPQSVGAFVSALFTTGEGWAMIIIGNLVGLVFAAMTLLVSMAFPMVVDRPGVDAFSAIVTSIHAVNRNRTAFARWGLTVAVLLAIGCIPLFVGLAVVLPLLGYATFHLYRRVIAR